MPASMAGTLVVQKWFRREPKHIVWQYDWGSSGPIGFLLTQPLAMAHFY